MNHSPKDSSPSINYLYYSFIFLFLTALTVLHFFESDHHCFGLDLFFLLQALGQTLLEVFFLILAGRFIRQKAPPFVFKLYIGLSFTCLLAHFADFIMLRLIDVPISYFFKFFFGSGLEHCLSAFLALNMNFKMIAIIFGSFLLVPLSGLLLYWITQKASLKKPLELSHRHLFFGIVGIAIVLLISDFATTPHLSRLIYQNHIKILPLGSTFFSPSSRILPLPSPIRRMPNESHLQQLLTHEPLSSSPLPNIYLFVIETLRHDFITSDIAPHLTAFAHENIAFPYSFANANSTHLSWFSIFHGCYPYHWTHVRDKWEHGSIPLHALKKLGYKIRVYSSADFSYFNMDRILFGKHRSLVDSIEEYTDLRDLDPCERDQIAINAVLRDSSSEPSGTAFLVFLDSTHSEYSSPPDFPHPFQPTCGSIDYLSINRSSNDLFLLKNRYRNAIYWIDHLMNRVFSHLKSLDIYNQSILVLTGDHGEEFYEDGSLFHGTHLNDAQTKVPLLMKFPNTSPPPCPLASHIDIFPSILHFLTQKPSWKPYCDGKSIFTSDCPSFILSVQHNASEIPYEFSLTDGKNRLLARFLNPPRIYETSAIEFLSLRGTRSKELEATSDDWIANSFESLLEKPGGQNF